MAGVQVPWVPISPGRRVAYGIIAILFLALALGVVWLDIQARTTGMCDGGIIGGGLAGGGFLAYSAIMGRERRKMRT